MGSHSLIYSVILILSGLSSMMLQIIWIRDLSLILGRTSESVALTVGVFMLGLGLGAIYWGHLSSRRNFLPNLFFRIQLGAAIASILTSALYVSLRSTSLPLAVEQFLSTDQGSILLYPLILIPMFLAAFFMGGALPVLVALLTPKVGEVSRGIGKMYGYYSIGAVAGTVFAGYLLLGRIGMFYSELIAIALLVLTGLLFRFTNRETKIIERGDSLEKQTSGKMAGGRSFLVVAVISSIGGIGYQILMERAVAVFSINSSYSFSSILLVYLIGTSIGSFLFHQKLSNGYDRTRIIFIICSVLALFYSFAAGALLLFPFITALGTPLYKIAGNLEILLPGIVLSSLLFVVPAVLLGMLFPLLCHAYSEKTGRIGSSVGAITAADAIGGVVGALLSGFVLIPSVGVKVAIIIYAVLFACIAAFFLLKLSALRPISARCFAYSFFVIVTIIGLFVYAKSDPYVHPLSFFKKDGGRDSILYYKETAEGNVIVRARSEGSEPSLYVNNNAVCGLDYNALAAVKMLAHLPWFTNVEARNALVIGFGIGVTTGELSRHPLDRIDCIEICPGVREAAGFFSQFNRNSHLNKIVSFINGDGRTHLQLSNREYDIISCDPTHPIYGSASLYTLEYFTLCKKRLSENGVVVQYLPLHGLSDENLKSVAATFQKVFPHATLWLGHSHGILLGTQQPLSLDFRDITQQMKDLGDPLFADPYEFASSLIFNETDLVSFAEGGRIHTDNYPFLDFFSPDNLNRSNWAYNMNTLAEKPSDPSTVFINVDSSKILLNYITGTSNFRKGLILQYNGDVSGAEHEFQQVQKLTPLRSAIHLFLK